MKKRKRRECCRPQFCHLPNEKQNEEKNADSEYWDGNDIPSEQFHIFYIYLLFRFELFILFIFFLAVAVRTSSKEVTMIMSVRLSV